MEVTTSTLVGENRTESEINSVNFESGKIIVKSKKGEIKITPEELELINKEFKRLKR